VLRCAVHAHTIGAEAARHCSKADAHSTAQRSEQSGIIVIGDTFTVKEVRSCRSCDR
jgi:hypothetical protein